MATVTTASLNDVVLKSVELPVLPSTAQKVLSLMSDPDISIEKVKRIIGSDPALAAKILKVANSAFYGGFRNIQNLSQAILRLGLNSVRNIVIATSLKNVYKRFGLTEKLLWEQMIGSAMASNLLARQTRRADAEDAFIGGLLHDIGKVVINNEYPEAYARVMEKVYNDAVPFSIAEKEVFRFSHREVGAAIVKKWGFPESIEKLLRYFDDNDLVSKDRNMFNLVSIILMSDRLCQKFGMGWRKSPEMNVDFGNLSEILGLNDERMNDIFEKVQEVFSQGTDLY